MQGVKGGVFGVEVGAFHVISPAEAIGHFDGVNEVNGLSCCESKGFAQKRVAIDGGVFMEYPPIVFPVAWIWMKACSGASPYPGCPVSDFFV